MPNVSTAKRRLTMETVDGGWEQFSGTKKSPSTEQSSFPIQLQRKPTQKLQRQMEETWKEENTSEIQNDVKKSDSRKGWIANKMTTMYL